MTLVFFVVRVSMLSYLVAKMLPDAYYKANSHEKEPMPVQVGVKLSVGFFLILLLLNYFWFIKMVRGSAKYLLDKDSGDTKRKKNE